MATKSLQRSPNAGLAPGLESKPYRMVWMCLPVMLALSGAVLLVFGVSWWTALVVVVLLACPAAMATAIYFGFQPLPRASESGSTGKNAPR